MLSIGIITSDNTNNKLYYEVNQKFEYYEPLKQIFGGGLTPTGAATVAADEKIDTGDDLKSIGHVELAVLTGQFTRDDGAGVDFLVVGDVNHNAVQKYVNELEARENKAIRYTVMSLSDFKYRQQIRDRFATAIRQAKKQILVDKHNLLSNKKAKKEEE